MIYYIAPAPWRPGQPGSRPARPALSGGTAGASLCLTNEIGTPDPH